MVEKIDTYSPLSDIEINELWKQIEYKYKLNLIQYGVKLPVSNTNAAYQLIYLYKYVGKLVHKDVITSFVKDKNKNSSGDQQVRHLATQKGFNIGIKNDKIMGDEQVPSGYYILLDLDTPKPSWILGKNKRLTVLNASCFDDIKRAFGYKCATCGVMEGEVHKITKKKVKLQQGHINPSKDLSLDNCIPQCDYCNQQIYKDNFIFDENGYPNRIYNASYILRSDKDVKEKMLKLLEEERNKGII